MSSMMRCSSEEAGREDISPLAVEVVPLIVLACASSAKSVCCFLGRTRMNQASSRVRLFLQSEAEVVTFCGDWEKGIGSKKTRCGPIAPKLGQQPDMVVTSKCEPAYFHNGGQIVSSRSAN